MSHFERYGGLPFVSKMVLDFYDRVLGSERLAPYFESVDMRRLVDHQAKFISAIMEGPTSYTGEMLMEIHGHLEVDEAAFEEMVTLLGETMVAFEIEEPDRQAILDRLRTARTCIVR
jgi:hemoglobin